MNCCEYTANDTDFFYNREGILENRWSSSRLRGRGGERRCVGRGAHHLFHSPRSNPAVFYLDTRGFLTFFHGVTGDGRPSTYPEAWTTLDFRARLCRERSGLIQDHAKSLCCAIGKDTLLSQYFSPPGIAIARSRQAGLARLSFSHEVDYCCVEQKYRDLGRNWPNSAKRVSVAHVIRPSEWL